MYESYNLLDRHPLICNGHLQCHNIYELCIEAFPIEFCVSFGNVSSAVLGGVCLCLCVSVSQEVGLIGLVRGSIGHHRASAPPSFNLSCIHP